MQAHKTVSREEWIEARRDLLAKEKAHLKAHDALARERRALPWVKVDKNYVFEGPNGKETLADLFAGRSQLIVKHFMMGPDWKEGCVGCSFGADQLEGSVVHLDQPRRHAGRDLARALPEDRRLPQAHGLALQVGVVERLGLQLRLPRLLHRGRQGRAARRSTISRSSPT